MKQEGGGKSNQNTADLELSRQVDKNVSDAFPRSMPRPEFVSASLVLGKSLLTTMRLSIYTIFSLAYTGTSNSSSI